MKVNKSKGFTLIELVVVIVILGILSATALPKFIDFQTDAHAAVVSATGGALKTGVSFAHTKWYVNGANGAMDNLDIYGTGNDLMNINKFGWPAQVWNTFEDDPQLNNTNDCISVWNAVLESGSPTVKTDLTADYQVTYSSNACKFIYVKEPEFSISYNSLNGNVIIDSTLQ